MSGHVVMMKLPITSCPELHLLNHENGFHGGMFKLNADVLLYSFIHFEYDCNTGHMLTQRHLPPPLTSTVKSPLFTRAPSSPLSLLPGYIDVVQNIFSILPMARLLPDRPRVYV